MPDNHGRTQPHPSLSKRASSVAAAGLLCLLPGCGDAGADSAAEASRAGAEAPPSGSPTAPAGGGTAATGGPTPETATTRPTSTATRSRTSTATPSTRRPGPTALASPIRVPLPIDALLGRQTENAVADMTSRATEACGGTLCVDVRVRVRQPPGGFGCGVARGAIGARGESEVELQVDTRITVLLLQPGETLWVETTEACPDGGGDGGAPAPQPETTTVTPPETTTPAPTGP